MARKAASKSAKGKKGKRRVSSVRGSAARRKDSGADPRGVAGIVILCIGLLAFISQFMPSSGGVISWMAKVAHGLGGTLCMLLPLMLCWAGATLVFFASGHMKLKTMICGALMFLIVETMLQLFQIGAIQAAIFADGKTDTYGLFLARSFEASTLDYKGGGLIGALLAWPLYKGLDIWGAMIVLLFASVIVLMVFTGVSFSGVGMYLSELIDDLRVSMNERQEEKNALKKSREEEALRAEAELAVRRQKKRADREMQKEQKEAQKEARKEEPEEIAEEKRRDPAKAQQEAKEAVRQRNAVRRAPEACVQADGEGAQQEDMPKPARRHKSKALQEEQIAGWPTRQTAERAPEPESDCAPVSRMKPVEETPLYIAPDEEFVREGIDQRREMRGMRRRNTFTMEEAERAFLYGMNGGQGDNVRAFADAAAAKEEQAQQMERESAGFEAEETPSGDAYDGQTNGTPRSTPLEAQEDAWGEEQAGGYAGQAYPGDEMASGAEPEPETEPERPAIRRVRTPLTREDDADTAESTPLQRSILAAQRAAEGVRVQDVLAGQQAAAQNQPVVQLRENRMDGTPMVMPRRDTHEAPKILNEEYAYPPLDLLREGGSTYDPNLKARIEESSRNLLTTLSNFGVQAELTHVTHGPAITRYELKPAPGVKVSRIVNLVDDIALNMASDGVRIEAPIPGKPAVGIEIPNERIEMVGLRDVLESREMTREKSPTAVALGKGISGAPVIADMAKMPHVLIAGATGSGKSVCINTIITSIIYRASPQEVRLILIDPKVVELSVYNGIPHLLVPVVTDPKKASAALSWAVVEMEHRYKRFETMGVRNIQGYNAAIGPDEEPMSKIIVIIDELADLMMVAPGEVEDSICRLAQLARAAGIHLVIATQRPSVNVITGVIKANIPSRIAFAVSSQIDSRTILDSAGAEKLLGRGDMLYSLQGAGKPTRVQGCFVSDEEIMRIVSFVRGKHEADYNEDVIEQMNNAAVEEKSASGDAQSGAEPMDEMLAKAIELAIDAGQISISMLQRRLHVGYMRACRMVDEMTERGIAGEAEGPTKPRSVLISREEWRRMQENQE